MSTFTHGNSIERLGNDHLLFLQTTKN